MNLSRSRLVLKVTGVTLAILGIIAIFYAFFVMQSIHIYYLYNLVQNSFSVAAPEHPSRGFNVLLNIFWKSYFDVMYYRTYHASIGFVGFVLLFLGYKSYRFIPPSERDEQIHLNITYSSRREVKTIRLRVSEHKYHKIDDIKIICALINSSNKYYP